MFTALVLFGLAVEEKIAEVSQAVPLDYLETAEKIAELAKAAQALDKLEVSDFKSKGFACHPNCNPKIFAYLERTETEYEYFDTLGVRIAFLPHLSGGGKEFGLEYARYIFNELVRYTGPLERCFEWCAGPAFIGFMLLASKYCRTLALADVNPTAIAAMRHTVEINGLSDFVDIYLSDNLDDIPSSEHDSWDLVVGNPPHVGRVHGPRTGWWNASSLPRHLSVDVRWRLHRQFYSTVLPFLRPRRGQIIIQENLLGSPEMGKEFIPFLSTELVLRKIDPPTLPYDKIYFFWASVADAWLDGSPLHVQFQAAEKRVLPCPFEWMRDPTTGFESLEAVKTDGCDPRLNYVLGFGCDPCLNYVL